MRPYGCRRAAILHWLLVPALALLAGARAGAVPWTFTVTDDAGRPLTMAVVAVYVDGHTALAPSGTVAEMGQRDRQFAPQMIAVQTGTLVSFPNYDTVRHHVYSFSPVRPFEIKLYSSQPPKSILFDKPGTATLGCNIHDRMLAWIHVVSTPVFATTDAAGTVRLDLPAGTHRVAVWQPRVLDDGPDIEHELTVTQKPGGETIRVVHP